MKTLKFSLLLLFAPCTMTLAQDWNLNGNALGGTEKLGSTNAQPINFYTNNSATQRATITSAGLFGIGTTASPAYLLDVNGDTMKCNKNLIILNA
jgi:hypothetical protein